METLRSAQGDTFTFWMLLLPFRGPEHLRSVGELLRLETDSMLLNILTERDRQSDQYSAIYEAVITLAGRLQLLERELRLSDSCSIRSEADRSLVKQLAAQYRVLPERHRRYLPALVHTLGMLELAAGEFDDAQ